jgi:hypothetical protein
MTDRSLLRVRAVLAMEEGRPKDAVAALEPAQPYDLADFTVPTQRAEAYLKARQGEAAAKEYSKILAHSGVDLSHLYPMPVLAWRGIGFVREKGRKSHRI